MSLKSLNFQHYCWPVLLLHAIAFEMKKKKKRPKYCLAIWQKLNNVQRKESSLQCSRILNRNCYLHKHGEVSIFVAHTTTGWQQRWLSFAYLIWVLFFSFFFPGFVLKILFERKDGNSGFDSKKTSFMLTNTKLSKYQTPIWNLLQFVLLDQKKK